MLGSEAGKSRAMNGVVAEPELQQTTCGESENGQPESTSGEKSLTSQKCQECQRLRKFTTTMWNNFEDHEESIEKVDIVTKELLLLKNQLSESKAYSTQLGLDLQNKEKEVSQLRVQLSQVEVEKNNALNLSRQQQHHDDEEQSAVSSLTQYKFLLTQKDDEMKALTQKIGDVVERYRKAVERLQSVTDEREKAVVRASKHKLDLQTRTKELRCWRAEAKWAFSRLAQQNLLPADKLEKWNSGRLGILSPNRRLSRSQTSAGEQSEEDDDDEDDEEWAMKLQSMVTSQEVVPRRRVRGQGQGVSSWSRGVRAGGRQRGRGRGAVHVLEQTSTSLPHSRARDILASAYNAQVTKCAKQKMLDKVGDNKRQQQNGEVDSVSPLSNTTETPRKRSSLVCCCDDYEMSAVWLFMRQLAAILSSGPVTPLGGLRRCVRPSAPSKKLKVEETDGPIIKELLRGMLDRVCSLESVISSAALEITVSELVPPQQRKNGPCTLNRPEERSDEWKSLRHVESNISPLKNSLLFVSGDQPSRSSRRRSNKRPFSPVHDFAPVRKRGRPAKPAGAKKARNSPDKRKKVEKAVEEEFVVANSCMLLPANGDEEVEDVSNLVIDTGDQDEPQKEVVLENCNGLDASASEDDVEEEKVSSTRTAKERRKAEKEAEKARRQKEKEVKKEEKKREKAEERQRRDVVKCTAVALGDAGKSVASRVKRPAVLQPSLDSPARNRVDEPKSRARVEMDATLEKELTGLFEQAKNPTTPAAMLRRLKTSDKRDAISPEVLSVCARKALLSQAPDMWAALVAQEKAAAKNPSTSTQPYFLGVQERHILDLVDTISENGGNKFAKLRELLAEALFDVVYFRRELSDVQLATIFRFVTTLPFMVALFCWSALVCPGAKGVEELSDGLWQVALQQQKAGECVVKCLCFSAKNCPFLAKCLLLPSGQSEERQRRRLQILLHLLSSGGLSSSTSSRDLTHKVMNVLLQLVGHELAPALADEQYGRGLEKLITITLAELRSVPSGSVTVTEEGDVELADCVKDLVETAVVLYRGFGARKFGPGEKLEIVDSLCAELIQAMEELTRLPNSNNETQDELAVVAILVPYLLPECKVQVSMAARLVDLANMAVEFCRRNWSADRWLTTIIKQKLLDQIEPMFDGGGKIDWSWLVE